MSLHSFESPATICSSAIEDILIVKTGNTLLNTSVYFILIGHPCGKSDFIVYMLVYVYKLVVSLWEKTGINIKSDKSGLFISASFYFTSKIITFLYIFLTTILAS